MWRIARLSGKKKNSGQNLMEYGLILGVVAIALLTMQTYFKRGIQSVIKVVADDYGPQGDPVGRLEMAIKSNIITNRGSRITTNSTTTGLQLKKMINRGGSDIRTETSGNTTTKTDSFAISGYLR